MIKIIKKNLKEEAEGIDIDAEEAGAAKKELVKNFLSGAEVSFDTVKDINYNIFAKAAIELVNQGVKKDIKKKDDEGEEVTTLVLRLVIIPSTAVRAPTRPALGCPEFHKMNLRNTEKMH